MLGGDEQQREPLYRGGACWGFAAIGDNFAREKVTGKMENIGYQMISVVSRYAVVSPFAEIAPGTLVMPGAVVNACAHIGRGCVLRNEICRCVQQWYRRAALGAEGIGDWPW